MPNSTKQPCHFAGRQIEWALADSAKSGIGKVTGEITRANEAAKKALQEQSDALDDLLKYVEAGRQIESAEHTQEPVLQPFALFWRQLPAEYFLH